MNQLFRALKRSLRGQPILWRGRIVPEDEGDRAKADHATSLGIDGGSIPGS